MQKFNDAVHDRLDVLYKLGSGPERVTHAARPASNRVCLHASDEDVVNNASHDLLAGFCGVLSGPEHVSCTHSDRQGISDVVVNDGLDVSSSDRGAFAQAEQMFWTKMHVPQASITHYRCLLVELFTIYWRIRGKPRR